LWVKTNQRFFSFREVLLAFVFISFWSQPEHDEARVEESGRVREIKRNAGIIRGMNGDIIETFNQKQQGMQNH